MPACFVSLWKLDISNNVKPVALEVCLALSVGLAAVPTRAVTFLVITQRLYSVSCVVTQVFNQRTHQSAGDGQRHPSRTNSPSFAEKLRTSQAASELCSEGPKAGPNGGSLPSQVSSGRHAANTPTWPSGVQKDTQSFPKPPTVDTSPPSLPLEALVVHCLPHCHLGQLSYEDENSTNVPGGRRSVLEEFE